MTERISIDEMAARLAERFGDLGSTAAQRLRDWLNAQVPYAHSDQLLQLLRTDCVELLFDSFWQVLPFGTGGRRGPVGYGSNRMNDATVAMTVQGHCNYLRSRFERSEPLKVVVANDVRRFSDLRGIYGMLEEGHPLLGASSRSFAYLACEIYAANGIQAYLARPEDPSAVLTTPELSFAIRSLHAHGGINLSASHNPPDDNGIKVFDDFGSQPIAPQDQHLVDRMNDVKRAERMPLGAALRKGLVLPLPEQIQDEYVRTYTSLYGLRHAPDPLIPIVYTPLCGCGQQSAGRVLEQLGFQVHSPANQGPDGSFKAIPFRTPNPEVPQSTTPAQEFADSIGASIVLSSDPDADRIGVDVRIQGGHWYHFDGNQIATLLCYFLMLDPAGPRRSGLVLETLVTTRLLEKIAKLAGDSQCISDLLVGFKYVANVLKQLDSSGEFRGIHCSANDLVLAAEESHGVIVSPTIRDKDSTPACMYLAALHQILQKSGSDLLRYYSSILQEVGSHDCVSRAIMLGGASGMASISEIMRSLRTTPPQHLADLPVTAAIDYWDEEMFGPFESETDRLPRNVIQYTTGSFIVTVRPSGTEPKLKFYCEITDSSEDASAVGNDLLASLRARALQLTNRLYNELLSRIGLSLSAEGLTIPDIVELKGKLMFQDEILPGFSAALAGGEFRELESALAWLARRCAPLLPGSDPLPAFNAAIRVRTQQVLKDDPRNLVATQLLEWTS